MSQTTRYAPHAEILPIYTDEALRNETAFKGDAARALLRLPAEYRQTCEVEVDRRSTRTLNSEGFLCAQRIANSDEMRSQVVAEVLAQVARNGAR